MASRHWGTGQVLHGVHPFDGHACHATDDFAGEAPSLGALAGKETLDKTDFATKAGLLRQGPLRQGLPRQGPPLQGLRHQGLLHRGLLHQGLQRHAYKVGHRRHQDQPLPRHRWHLKPGPLHRRHQDLPHQERADLFVAKETANTRGAARSQEEKIGPGAFVTEDASAEHGKLEKATKPSPDKGDGYKDLTASSAARDLFKPGLCPDTAGNPKTSLCSVTLTLKSGLCCVTAGTARKPGPSRRHRAPSARGPAYTAMGTAMGTATGTAGTSPSAAAPGTSPQ